MPIVTHSVVFGDVLGVLPFDTRAIGANSQPVNDVKITGWIEDGAAHVNAILESKGVNYANLESSYPNAFRVVKRMVVVYAALRVCDAMAETSAVRTNLKEELDTGMRALERRSYHKVGNAQPARAVVHSNIPRQRSTTRQSWRNKKW